MPRKRASQPPAKLFILDANVLMHDPTSLFRFEEHDIFLPMKTLEELDHNKKGVSDVARNARQATRMLDEIISRHEDGIAAGIPLAEASHGLASGCLLLQTEAADAKPQGALATGRADMRADNPLLAVVVHLRRKYPKRAVILVSKDINMRIKAHALGLQAQDYFNDRALEDIDLLYRGMQALPADFWEVHAQGLESWAQAGRTRYRIQGGLCARLLVNEFVYLDAPEPFAAIVRESSGNVAQLETLIDYTHPKHKVWGITARNREQNFALNLLMDPEIDFVSLLGQAGTGKTLLTLAAALTQTLDDRRYQEIIMTRATVPVGEDIGFLPGTEEEKMAPWMGALEDNLEALGNAGNQAGGDWGRAATQDLIRNRIKIKSLNFMRGRTFLNKFLIIDEAQNLTPKQMKTLITRAGPGAKVVCMGNIAQIDTPYLTEGSSGLTFVVDRFKGWAHAGHVTLQRGERSRLADYAAERL